MENHVLLDVRNLVKHFPVTEGILQRKSGEVKAVNGVSFAIDRGETLGLVGESGCGKTTSGRCILQLVRPTGGQVIFEGVDLCQVPDSELRSTRKRMQVIFQDPYSSLNPRLTVGAMLNEVLETHEVAKGRARDELVDNILDAVQLDPSMKHRYPHMFSGGQRQRVAIARALILNPSFVVCDEPVSALDVSIQAQIINLLMCLQAELGLAYLFIAHDLAVVQHISHKVAVMYLGKVVELSPRDELFHSPAHPYTKALVSAAPIPDCAAEAQRKRIVLEGEPPSPMRVPPGCPFHPRCREALALCREEEPSLEGAGGHWVACHRSN